MAQGRRRDAILSAAGDEFAQHGFSGARIERIAVAAAVNKQLIFHYFQSKEGLYSAVTAALFGSWAPVADTTASSPAERLRQLTTYLVAWLHDHPGAARAIADSGRVGEDRTVESAAPPTGAAVWIANARGALRSTVEGGQRQGYFRDDVDPLGIAEVVISAAVGHALAPGPEARKAEMESARLAANLSLAMVEYCAWR